MSEIKPGDETERAFLEWLNEYTRHEAEPGRTTWDELRAAFTAGAEHASSRWWITTGPIPAGGEKVLGPFCSQELALKVRMYLEFATQSAGRTYWVDDEPATARGE